MRDYQIVSPSLEGVLNHDSLLYDGVERPLELIRILDGPVSRGRAKESVVVKELKGDSDIKDNSDLNDGNPKRNTKLLERYFHDLYGVFMKRFSYFIVQSDIQSDDSIKLQAMLQEMIKVKKWMNESHGGAR